MSSLRLTHLRPSLCTRRCVWSSARPLSLPRAAEMPAKKTGRGANLSLLNKEHPKDKKGDDDIGDLVTSTSRTTRRARASPPAATRWCSQPSPSLVRAAHGRRGRTSGLGPRRALANGRSPISCPAGRLLSQMAPPLSLPPTLPPTLPPPLPPPRRRRWRQRCPSPSPSSCRRLS